MANSSTQKNIRVISLYIVVILALIRFLIYPLHGAIAGKKVILSGLGETFKLKSRMIRQQDTIGVGQSVDKEFISPYVYQKGVGYSYIQADILERVTKLAEARGLTVLNFEMPVTTPGKNISEVPVIVRLQGPQSSFVEIMEMIAKNGKLLIIKSTEINKIGLNFQYSLSLSAFRMER